MAVLRVYIDTSVIGGCEDEEFADESRRLFAASSQGQVVLLVSPVVLREVGPAPARVRSRLADLPAGAVEEVPISDEVTALRDAYLAGGVVGPARIDDATHVAAATVAGADAIVSWNFQHIVRLDRIKGYNRVNRSHGYRDLTILSPREVRLDECHEVE
ncbi:PIN domain-containing protein [bacterium]|nr:PIN domain-containing protein [bacterium]